MKYQQDVKELIELIKVICTIPSPTRHEHNKAVFINEWLHKIGANSFIDEKNNVIYEYGNQNAPQIAFIAHIDTVYSVDTQLNIYENDEILKCPSVNDNSANVAGLMIAIKNIIQERISIKRYRFIFVFSTCEEALGNSDGCRFFLSCYKNIKEAIILDGDYSSILCDAVGSERYKVLVSTIGGHSFRNSGNSNAIQIISHMIQTLYGESLPNDSKSITTFNVGIVSGGTSVTAIASSAYFQCEYRSNCHSNLIFMRKRFLEIIQQFKNQDCNIEITLIGSRPCSVDVNKLEQEKLLERVESVFLKVLGEKAPRKPRSTDGSICLSMGIPTTSLSVYKGKGNHSEHDETLFKESLPNGMKMLFYLFESYIQ